MLPTANRGLPALLGLLFVTALLAGCHAPEGAGDENDDDAMPGGGDGGDGDGMMAELHIGLGMRSLPESVMVGETFNVTVDYEVENGPATSNHMGAHYWMNSTGDSPSTTGSQASPHVSNETTLDGTGSYTITGWSFASAGTYYVRAHVLTTDGKTFWGEERTIEVTA